jgi:ribose transport system ATP-binding protein
MTAAASDMPLLEARGLSKRFPGVQALAEVSAAFHAGEVVAVMGENGAGKSTLMKALAGVHPPDAGTILWQGKPVRISNVSQAGDLGIAFIHQELNLCENLTVEENIFLGLEPRRAGWLVDRRALREKATALLARVGLKVRPDAVVESLSIGQRQMVEIARALAREASLVIMDEPTSSLTSSESARLFEVVRDLKSRGLAVVFISHRLAEVMAVADRVIVLKDGRNSGSLTKFEITADRMVQLMVGRDLDPAMRRPESVTTGAERLSVNGLKTVAWPTEEVSFSVRAGEIVGMAGLVGAGRTEVARCLAGVDRPLSGTVRVDGKTLPPGSVSGAIKAGLALAPEDRKEQGIFLEMPIRENIALPGLGRMQSAGFVRQGHVTALAERLRQQLNIRTTDVQKAAGLLSGGNQQKIVLAKWLVLDPGVFILDEPTRGVDVGAKAEIYRVIEALAAAGAAVLMISSDLEEILRLSDRVLVMHEGRLAGEVCHTDLSEEAIMQLATGSAQSSAKAGLPPSGTDVK